VTKDQAELPGVRPEHVKRLEEIEAKIKANEGKVSRLRAENRELSDEAVGLWKTHKLKSTRIVDDQEWYVDSPREKYKHRKFKDSNQEAGAEPADKSKKEKATA